MTRIPDDRSLAYAWACRTRLNSRLERDPMKDLDQLDQIEKAMREEIDRERPGG
jgi:hypothetical protein